MPEPQKPTALYMQNGWYLEMAGLISPHFQTLEGLDKKTGTTTIVDAGSNINYKFSDQIRDFGKINLGRTLDGSTDDVTFDALVEMSLNAGVKHQAVLVKRHYNQEVFRIIIDGLLFVRKAHPTNDVNGTDQYKMAYEAEVDEWIQI